MSYLDQKVQHGKPLFVAHKQGRFVQEICGYLLHPNGNNIDLHDMLTGHRTSVNLYPVKSNEMRVSGLHRGAFAVVDRAAEIRPGNIVVVRCGGVVVMRRLMKKNGSWCLAADDPREPDFIITEETEVERLGRVTHCIIEL